MADRTPNLFVVGAMRSGTTALHEVLGDHPDVFMSPVKEPAYFADPAELAGDSRVAAAAGYARNRAGYLELFADAGAARYRGESSTHYTKLPRITGVAGRIAAESSAARILYLVRDPVRRTLSHYRYHVRAKYERRSCLDALREEPIYTATSDYIMQISPYLDRFGERVRMLVLEELVADPVEELADLYAWLGIAPDAHPHVMPQRNEVSGEVSRARGPEALHAIGRSARYQRLARSVLTPGLRSKVRRLLNQPVAGGDTTSPAVLDHLRAVHEPHAAAVERHLGRPMTKWTALRPDPAS